MILSVIIPVYNEEKTILQILKRVKKQKKFLNIQVIVSNDGSTDRTLELLKKNPRLYDHIVINKKNLGKGMAIKKASNYIKGDIVLIQDADLEYSPKDYKKLIQPIKNRVSNVVYGSRVLKFKNRYSSTNKFTSKIRIFGNHFLTVFSNIINDQKLTDAHTCYKVFSKKIFSKLKLKHNDFSFCPEATTKVSLLKEKIIEVPINYKGRSYLEGKKIGFSDAFIAMYTIIKFRIFK